MSMDIIVSHIDEDDARLTLRYSGDRLQLNGYGRDWERARAAYDAAHASSPATTASRRSSCPSRPATPSARRASAS